MTETTQTPDTATGFLENLVGTDVTFRLAGSPRGAWGPYKLLAVYPEGPLPAILVQGSRDYLVPLANLLVIHEGAKPTQAEHYARKHGGELPSGVQFPGIDLEDDDDEDDEE